jgi:hypothetical protein
MRILVSAVLAAGMVLLAAPAHAQAYDPNFPICMELSGPLGGGYTNCSFTSLAQCAASASGRSAYCLVNPFYAHPAPGRAYRSQRPLY